MDWTVYLTAAFLVFAAAAAGAFAVGKKSYFRAASLVTPYNLVFVGLFLASYILLLPVYGLICEGAQLWGLKTALFALQGTFKMFTIDADSEIVIEYISGSVGRIAPLYSAAVTVLFVVDPVFTFGFLVLLFQNTGARIRFFLGRRRPLYLFSRLNEKSLALAGDIRKHHPGSLIVFTDVFPGDGENSQALSDRAGEIGGICFKKDILALNLKLHSTSCPLYLFAVSGDEAENIGQALKLIQAYGNVPHSRLYVLSTGIEGELLLAHTGSIPMKVRRINEVRSLINRTLYEHGPELFRNAVPAERAEDGRNIHAVVLGLGLHGTEMVKALAWYCQMDGYHIRIDAFDRDDLAGERFEALCPELMSEAYNGVIRFGEAEYTIRIHSGMDADTRTFADQIAGMRDATYVFIALGSDAVNVKAAVNLRMLFERAGIRPVIQTVVYDSEEKEALRDLTNYRGQRYDIDWIGDIASSFSEKVILNSELEEEALRLHKKWGKEEEFWQYEYNYRSSTASALHRAARTACGIPGADKPESELTEAERDGIERLEHRRWNAYMRAEGYVYSGSREKSSRNDLAKMHHDLVDYAALTEEEKRKDSRVGTR